MTSHLAMLAADAGEHLTFADAIALVAVLAFMFGISWLLLR